jgi:hypothetical protein
MAKNDIRVTYAVDRQTVTAIEELAAKWGVSKSEAMRRAIRMTHDRMHTILAGMTQRELLEYCMKNPTRTKEEGEAWQREAYELRKSSGELERAERAWSERSERTR